MYLPVLNCMDASLDDTLGKLVVKKESQEAKRTDEILRAAGVRYSHRNSDVVASSHLAKKENAETMNKVRSSLLLLFNLAEREAYPAEEKDSCSD